MKNFEILLNNKYSATTQANTSGLDLQNDYYVYINKNGGGIVNAYNVRGYLNDVRNKQITTDFFAFLTGSTSQDQALNILSSDKKLSDVFNDYYQRVIISATQISNTSVVQQNLTGTNQIIAYTFNHPWIGYAPNKQLTGITQEIYGSINNTQSNLFLEDFTVEQSYFIPVYLERGTKQINAYKYDICNKLINAKTAGSYPEFSAITSAYFGTDSISNILSLGTINSNIGIVSDVNLVNNINVNSEILTEINPNLILNLESNLNTNSIISTTFGSGQIASIEPESSRIHTLLNCFVDLNLETNENIIQINKLSNVSFEFSEYSVNEGQSVQVRVGLNSPSTFGIEQITVNLTSPIVYAANLGQDYIAAQNYPLTLTWSIGEQIKTLSFTALTGGFFENTESFLLNISNLINVDQGLIPNTVVKIINSPITLTEATLGTSLSANVFLELENENTELLYKYVHLNLGNIYSELGNNAGKTELKRIILPTSANDFNIPLLNISDYSKTLIKYGDGIKYRDISQTFGSTIINYYPNTVNVKITNTGLVQSVINNLTVLPGQNIILNVPINNYILTASTNDSQNINTNFYDYANYKIELINLYSGTTQYNSNGKFTLRSIDNISAASNNTLDIGTFLLSGMTNSVNDISNQYFLKSKYSEVFSGRINNGTINNPSFFCPSGVETYFATTIENISVLGIIFLNFNSTLPYINWPSTHYESFEFVRNNSITCSEVTNTMSSIDFKTIPFKSEI